MKYQKYLFELKFTICVVIVNFTIIYLGFVIRLCQAASRPRKYYKYRHGQYLKNVQQNGPYFQAPRGIYGIKFFGKDLLESSINHTVFKNHPNLCTVFEQQYIPHHTRNMSLNSLSCINMNKIFMYLKVYGSILCITYTHNWPLQPFSQDYTLASHTTHVVCVNFYT